MDLTRTFIAKLVAPSLIMQRTPLTARKSRVTMKLQTLVPNAKEKFLKTKKSWQRNSLFTKAVSHVSAVIWHWILDPFMRTLLDIYFAKIVMLTGILVARIHIWQGQILQVAKIQFLQNFQKMKTKLLLVSDVNPKFMRLKRFKSKLDCITFIAWNAMNVKSNWNQPLSWRQGTGKNMYLSKYFSSFSVFLDFFVKSKSMPDFSVIQSQIQFSWLKSRICMINNIRGTSNQHMNVDGKKITNTMWWTIKCRNIYSHNLGLGKN